MRKTRLTRKASPPRSARLPRSGIKASGKPIRKRNAKRHSAEWLRAYGSVARVEWVKSLPCIVPWCCRVEIENAHTKSGGTSRKANYETIVPACHAHHRELHQHGVRSFEAEYNIDLELAAIATEQQWLAHCARA